jgi:hypothetical protein
MKRIYPAPPENVQATSTINFLRYNSRINSEELLVEFQGIEDIRWVQQVPIMSPTLKLRLQAPFCVKLHHDQNGTSGSQSGVESEVDGKAERPINQLTRRVNKKINQNLS